MEQSQLVKNFLVLYGTRKFITVFTRARCWSLSWARFIQCPQLPTLFPQGPFQQYPPIYAKVFQVISSLQFSQTRISYAFLITHPCYIPHPSHPLWIDHPTSIWWRVQIIKLIMQFSPAFHYFLPVRISCSPQQSIVIHSQFMFLP